MAERVRKNGGGGDQRHSWDRAKDSWLVLRLVAAGSVESFRSFSFPFLFYFSGWEIRRDLLRAVPLVPRIFCSGSVLQEGELVDSSLLVG